MASKLIVVGAAMFDHSAWGTVSQSPAVYMPGDRRAGIKAAMRIAVKSANLGDVICQNDIWFDADPFAGDPTPGRVRTLSRPVSHRHCCPRAFLIYDEATRQAVVDAWRPESKGRACIAWRDIPKVADIIVAHHGDGG